MIYCLILRVQPDPEVEGLFLTIENPSESVAHVTVSQEGDQCCSGIPLIEGSQRCVIGVIAPCLRGHGRVAASGCRSVVGGDVGSHSLGERKVPSLREEQMSCCLSGK